MIVCTLTVQPQYRENMLKVISIVLCVSYLCVLLRVLNTYFAWMYLLVYGLQPQDVSVLYRVSLFNNCKGNVPLK